MRLDTQALGHFVDIIFLVFCDMEIDLTLRIKERCQEDSGKP